MSKHSVDTPTLPMEHPDLPFRLHVCSKNQVKKAAKRHGVTHVLTMLDPSDRLFLPPSVERGNHFALYFEDEEKHTAYAAPERPHMEAALAWASKVPVGSTLLVHCRAGRRRSTAVALALLVRFLGVERLDEAVALLTGNRPEAAPNRLMAHYADQLLGTGGRLLLAVQALLDARYEPGTLANTVFTPPEP